MKKYLLALSLLIVFFASYSLNAQVVLPAFSFTDLEGKTFTQANLDLNKPVMVMLFDPYCEHCEHQASWIAEKADQFKNVQFVFVTLEPDTEAIAAFRDRYLGKSGLDKLYFVQDTNVAFESYFGYTDDVVNIYLYSTQRRNPKYFGEEQAAEVLLKYL